MELTFSYVEETDSTNTRLKEAAQEGQKEGTVLSAGTQSAGRGRSGHTWASPRDTSISTSLLIYPKEIKEDRIALLTPLAAMAVCDAIESLYGLATQIKWVNDVLLSEKKICGILTERFRSQDGGLAVVIGIGINVHQQTFGADIADMATSIDLELQEEPGESGQRTSRRDITERLWRRFADYYETFVKRQDLDFIKKTYNGRLVNVGRMCRIHTPQGDYEGVALGIDHMGRLMVKREDDEVIRIDAGEVSVRGIYGYV